MNRVADVIRDDIKVMTAYQVADLPEGFIKLKNMVIHQLFEKFVMRLGFLPLRLYMDTFLV